MFALMFIGTGAVVVNDLTSGARLPAPVPVSGRLDAFWIHLRAPVIAGVLAGLVCRAIHEPDCRSQPRDTMDSTMGGADGQG